MCEETAKMQLLERSFMLRFRIRKALHSAIGLVIAILVVAAMAIRIWRRPPTPKPIFKQSSATLPWHVELKGSVTTLTAWVADVLVYVAELFPQKSIAVQMCQYSYPAAFRRTTVRVEDEDVTLSCVMAGQPTRTKKRNAEEGATSSNQMTVIIVPGMFNAASMSYFVSLACTAYYGWGANVLVADMRGHGETDRHNKGKPPSLCVGEANDIVSLARFAKREWGPDQSICLLGVSLGGTYALSAALAASAKQQTGLIKACAMISSPMDISGLIYTMSTMRITADSFNPWYAFYHWLLLQYCALRNMPKEALCFQSFISSVVIPSYPEKTSLASTSTLGPLAALDQLEVPLLAIYAEDDPVVTINEAKLLSERVTATNKSNLVQVITTKNGGHAGHFVSNKIETEKTLLEFFQGQL